MFFPLLGPWPALAGLVIPFAVFFPSPSLAALWRARKGRVAFAWSWRRLMRVQTLALPLTALAFSCGVLVVAPVDTLAFWIALVSLPAEVAAFAVCGAVEVRVAGVPADREGTSPRLRAVRPSVSSLVVVALLTAVGSGVCAWVVRDSVRTVIAGASVPVSDQAESIARWIDAQVASSVFGPTYDRQWYWAFLVGAAGLLATGCCLLLRNALLQATSETDPFHGVPGAFGIPAEPTSKVFLSYSRKDSAYARRLCARLEERLGELWVDWQAIHPSEEWREAIAEAIRTSDAFVVLLSRDALMSPYCWDECRQAIELRKRILPVVIDPELERGSTSGLMRERGWGELTAYQNLSLVEPDEEQLAQGIEDIVAFVHQHHRWVAFHVRLGVLAHQWWEGGRSDGLLLRADELSVAEAWRRRTPDEENFHTGLTEKQRRYLEASHSSVRRRTLRVRSALAAGTAAIVGLSGLVAAGQADAEAQYRAALSRKLAAMAAGDVFGTNPERALQYALAARGQADTAEAQNVIAEQLANFNRVRTVVAPGDGSVDELVLSRKGDVLLIARGDTTEVWDVQRARSRGLLQGSPLWSDRGGAGPLSADGRTVALLVDGGARVDLVDTRTLRVRAGLSDVEEGRPMDPSGGLSPDGELLLAGSLPRPSNESVNVVWDVRRHRIVRKLTCFVEGMAPSGRRVLCRDGDRFRLIDLMTSEAETIEAGSSSFVGFTADDGVLLNVSGEARIYEWGTARPRVPVPGMAVASSVDGGAALFKGRYAVFSADEERFELWDLEERRRMGAASSVEKAIDLRRGEGAPEFEPARSGAEAETADGSLVATAAVDGSVVIWEKSGTGRISERLPVPAKEGFYAVSPDARTVASSSGRTVSLWDTGTGERTGDFRLGEPGGMPALSRDGTLLAVATGLGEGRLNVEVFRVRDGRRVSRFEAGNDARNHIASLMFSPDGKKLYAALTGQWRVVAWDVADSGEEPRTVAETDGYADHATLSPDGTKLAVTSRNENVGLWDTASGARLRVIRDAANAAFSPDGKTLVTTDLASRSVSLWNVESGEKIGSDIVPGSGASRVQFSPDGRRLAIVGSPDGGLVSRLPVTLWDLSSRRQVGPRVAEVDAWATPGFTPDGDRVVTAGHYGTTVADVTADGWVSSLCGMVTRRLSTSEWQDAAPGERFRWPC
ncbi:toll/interleukin-1 receptor domain-containing protein [Streptomyces macrosporus]|uniref:toll/interleukin-1 receptor domain-containing protein n=1 Tax=Streptomyces macrosporus TaxID=44032 RepID=UPI0031D6D474